MHITILAFGTWGDVRPYGVMGQALKASGHEVQVIASPNFEEWIRARDLDYAPLQIDVQEIMNQLMLDNLNIMEIIRINNEVLAPGMTQMAHDTLDATAHSDVIIMMESGLSVVHGAIDKYQLTPIIMNMQLLSRTAEFPSAAFPALPEWFPFQGNINHLSHTLIQRAQWSMYGKRGNEVRTQRLNMSKRTWHDLQHDLNTLPTMTCVSPHVIPRPSDWGDNQHMIGFLFDDDPDWKPPQALVDFLSAGEKPVYIGFGSMSASNPKATTELLIEAMQKSGKRAVILSGWAGLGAENVPDSIHILKYAPHGWLFPKMACVVHHGGAGTTASSLRAGVPSLVVPFGADQPFWGQRVHRLGVGGKPIPRKKLTVDNLADSIQSITDSQSIKEKASALGEKIRQEDSVGQALAIIESALKA